VADNDAALREADELGEKLALALRKSHG
jgi:hypothetical protein